MSTPLFPRPAPNQIYGWRGLRWEKTITDRYHTITQTATTGRPARTAGYPVGLYDFAMMWEVLRDDRTKLSPEMPEFPKNELKLLRAFRMARRGGFQAFGIMDPFDKRTVGEVLSPSTPAPGDDLANPDSTVYQAVRTYGLLPDPPDVLVGGLGDAQVIGRGNTEPVGLINEGTDGEPAPLVYVFGNPVGFTANSPKDGWFTLDDAPPPGALLTGDFSYYFRVTFPDSQDFTTFGLEFWDTKLKLMAAPA